MKKMLILFSLFLAIAMSFVSCQKKDESTTGVITGSYQGAGSRWVANFTDTTFTIEKYATISSTTADLTVNGTYVEYSTKFRKLTVTSATGTGAPAAGTVAYGFEIPGFAFFLKPVGTNSEPIVMIKAGSCPSGTNFNANWIVAKFDAGQILNDTHDAFGSATFNLATPASASASINKLSAETGAGLGVNTINFDYTTCSNSKLTLSPGGGENVDMFFTDSGGALVHSYNGTTHDSIIFAAPKHTGVVTQTEMAATYSALVFDSSAGGEKLFPARLVVPVAGNATANKIGDIETDTATADPAIPIGNITAHAHSLGLFNTTIDPGVQNGRMNCAYTTVSSVKIIACNGYGSAAGAHNPFFVLARSR